MKSQYPLRVFPYREWLILALLALPVLTICTWNNLYDIRTGQALSAACVLLNLYSAAVLIGGVYSCAIRFDFSEDGITIHTLFGRRTVFHAWTEFSYVYVHTNYKAGRVLFLSSEEFNTRQPRQLCRILGFEPTHFRGKVVMEPGLSSKYIDMILPLIPETIKRIDVPKLF